VKAQEVVPMHMEFQAARKAAFLDLEFCYSIVDSALYRNLDAEWRFH
jgi:hypothetical protein